MPPIEVAKNASNQELYRPLVAMAKIPENADRISRVTKGVEAWMAAGDGEKPDEEQRMRDSFIGGLTKFGVKEILVETKDKKRYRVGQMPDGFRIINFKDLLDVSLDEKYSPQLRNELSQYADMVAMGTAEALVNTLINEGKVVGLYNENNLKDILDKDIVSGDHNVLFGVSDLASGIARNVRFGEENQGDDLRDGVELTEEEMRGEGGDVQKQILEEMRKMNANFTGAADSGKTYQSGKDKEEGSGGKSGNEAVMASLLGRQVGGDKEGGPSGQALMAQELLKHQLTGMSELEVKTWVLSVTDLLADNSLFWAGGWQQLTTYIDTQLSSFKDRYGLGENEEYGSFIEMKKFARAVATTRIQEAAIMHCDSTLETYLNMLPPADSMSEYVWNDGMKDQLLGDEVIGGVHDWLMEDAFSMENGAERMNEFRLGLADMDALAREYAYEFKQSEVFESYKEKMGGEWTDDLLIKQARTAISVFVVDDYIPWCAWVHSNLDTQVNGETISWMHRADLKAKRRAKAAEENFSNPAMTDVEIWNSTLEVNKDGGTGISHPLFVLVRPVDLLRIKNVYGEDLLGRLDDAFWMLTSEKWILKRDMDTPNKRITEKKTRMPPLSKMGWKDLVRYAKAWSMMIGNPQGDKLANMEKVVDASQQIQNMFSVPFYKEEIAGSIIGDILSVKIDALLVGKKTDSFLTNMLRTVAILGDYPKEQAAVVGQFYGTDLATDFGTYRDAISRLNLNLDTEEFVKARRRLATSLKDEKWVKLALGVKGTYLAADLIQAIVGSMKGGGGAGKRR